MASGIISTLAFLSLLGLNQAAGPNCEGLTKPLDLKDDYSSIMGRWIFTEGIADHDLFTNILKTVSSSWVAFSPGSSKDTVILTQGNKLNGTCEFQMDNTTIKNSTIYVTEKEIPTEGNLIPSCPECLTFSFTSQVKNETVKSLYFFTRSPKVSESEKDLYWKQAACLGFRTEPQYSYDGVTEFCEKDQIKPEDKKE
ncbi:saxitoxin and tetrodotoxin-binding protein 2 isoform X3 [Astyanax mexicanus]|uniref:Saxitoxin and tetrodotoxin-binding protein 2-like n=2 Tax=Astyanax mexicanus TaxID=7994 RepID=A0A8B9HI04_ASTMX|nr:saxitoxin and tetrodotoxin-binding protein 2 isoform X3 [Astyanax mexicanus]